MRKKKTPYVAYHDGQWTLWAIIVVTTVNLVLAAFSFGLFFPLSGWVPRLLLVQGVKSLAAQDPSGVWWVVGCVLLYLAYPVCAVLSYRSDRFPAMRAALVLYALDSAYFLLVVSLPQIASDGFRATHIIEFLFRGFAVLQFYNADRVFHDPARKDPSYRLPPPPPKDDAGDADDPDDDEDQGIQW